ncbi:MAG: hypothetical protein L7W40_05515, partial [Akkermansiaceae bacterium]|nr:hypothetical protein [Akkermansiaceae bacterium]
MIIKDIAKIRIKAFSVKTLARKLYILILNLVLSFTAALEAQESGDQISVICAKEQFSVTPALRAAFFSHAKGQALERLEVAGKSLPAEFLRWVDSDPDIATGVYAAHHKPESVLLWLYSLKL